MTQEDKDLLLKDLSARVPYGVKIQTDYTDAKTLKGIQYPDYIGISDGFYSLDYMECKPYLFPITSMTAEQKREYARIVTMSGNIATYQSVGMTVQDWFSKNHIDYRGLIPMGLANDATGLNIY